VDQKEMTCIYCNARYPEIASNADHPQDFCSLHCEDLYYEEMSEAQEEPYL